MPAMLRVPYLCNDLLFTSKIRETAQALGVEPVAVRDPAALLDAARGAAMVIIDLRLPTALDSLGRLRLDASTKEVPVVGFCDHEKVDLMERARAAGCTHVLAKGRFSSDLKTLLAPAVRTT